MSDFIAALREGDKFTWATLVVILCCAVVAASNVAIVIIKIVG